MDPLHESKDEDKLIPEWRVAADDQVLFAGLAVLAAMLIWFGWTTLQDNDTNPGEIAAEVSADADGESDVESEPSGTDGTSRTAD